MNELKQTAVSIACSERFPGIKSAKAQNETLRKLAVRLTVKNGEWVHYQKGLEMEKCNILPWPAVTFKSTMIIQVSIDYYLSHV